MEHQDSKRHLSNSGWVTYISPFTLIVPDDEEPMKVDLKEINSNTYNHGKLCRIISSFDIVSSDYKMLICYDGALAIPRLGLFSEKEKAVDFYSSILCKLLLGGLYCEAIDRRDVVNGQLHEKRAIWPVDLGESASSHFHSKLRMRIGGNIESIVLSNPNFIHVKDFHRFLNKGDKILSGISNLTPKFLIRGITEIKYRNWDLALSNLWIVVEQLIDYIWNHQFLKSESLHPIQNIEGRKTSLKDDNRTYSSSVKQEILYQSKLIDDGIISLLFPARKGRNKLIHEGRSVSQEVAIDIYKCVQLLLAKIDINFSNLLENIQVDPWKVVSDKKNFDESYFDDWKKFGK